MGKLDITFGDKVADKDNRYITRNVDGSYSCPCNYVIVKIDENTWQCEGGGHKYQMDEGELIKNKMGEMMIKKKDEHMKEVEE